MTRFCAMWQLDPNLTNVEPRNASVKRTGNREGRELCPQGARRGQLTDHLGRAPFARATKFDPTPWSCPFIPLFPTLAGGSKVSVGSKRASRVGPLLADIVAKVFLGWRTKILRAADASYARRREGPYRFIQNRPRVSAESLTSDAAAEKPRDRLSRDFLGCSIFDFCNMG
jgi:hypothetical protein